MNNEIKEILENIKCPQLGYDEYGKWGALPLNVRMTLKRLCDYVVSCDDYITNLQQIEQEHKKINGELREENSKLEIALQNIQEDYDRRTKENERLNEKLEVRRKICLEAVKREQDYKSCCEKASEFIKEKISSIKGVINDYMYHKEHNKHLIELLNEDIEMYKKELNILQNGSDDNE